MHPLLSEADAAVLSLEDRLRRPLEWGCRMLHGVGAAAVVGAFVKCRSSSRVLNRGCNMRAALYLSAGLEEAYMDRIRAGRAEPPIRAGAADGLRFEERRCHALGARLSPSCHGSRQAWPRRSASSYFCLCGYVCVKKQSGENEERKQKTR